METWLGNLKIGTRTWAGFAALLILMMFLSTIGVIGSQRASDGFSEYRSLARVTNLLGRIQANMLMARLGVKNFVIDETDAAIDMVNERYAATVSLLDEAQASDIDPERTTLFMTVRKEIDQYAAAFTSIVDTRSERQNAVAKLDDVGPRIREQLSQIVDQTYANGNAQGSLYAGKALETLLLGRLYVSKFLLKGDQDDAVRAFNEFTEANERFDLMTINLADPALVELAHAAHEGLHQYRTTFEGVVALIEHRQDIIANTLDRIGPIIAKNSEDAKLSVKARQDIIGPAMVAEMQHKIQMTLGLAGIAILLGVATAWIIGRSVSLPLARLTNSMLQLAEGNNKVEITGSDRRDEIGKAAGALEIFKSNAMARQRLEVSEKERVTRIETYIAEFDGDANQALTVLKIANQALTDVSSDIDESMTVSSQSVQDMAAATEELSASIREISENTSSSQKEASNSVARVGDASKIVETLARELNQISSVIELISDIAEQTNLLALNATIESARAGENGKGFAVVASEVKALAARTGQATGEIESKISQIQTSARQAVDSMAAIHKNISTIDEISLTIASAVEEQNTATNEIAKSAQFAADQASRVTRRISSQGASNANDQQDLHSTRSQLTTAADNLQTNINKFLDNIRAA